MYARVWSARVRQPRSPSRESLRSIDVATGCQVNASGYLVDGCRASLVAEVHPRTRRWANAARKSSGGAHAWPCLFL